MSQTMGMYLGLILCTVYLLSSLQRAIANLNAGGPVYNTVLLLVIATGSTVAMILLGRLRDD